MKEDDHETALFSLLLILPAFAILCLVALNRCAL